MKFNSIEEVVKSGKKYNIIYADPAWTFKTYDKRNVCPYDIMDDNDIYNMPVKEIAEKDCILFMWATFPKLETALNTMKAWGFKYKSLGFCWVKRNKKTPSWFWGMGFWTRQNAEVCLIGTKGHPHKASSSVHCIVDTPIEEHSKKPDDVRLRIERLMGDLPRIELFARQSAKGWDSMGNELNKGEDK